MKIFWAACALIFFCSINSFSQVNNDSLKVIKKEFESFEYQKVINDVNKLLVRKDTISKNNLKEIYRMKGISHFSINQDDSARKSFIQILQIDSSFNLDTSKTSPKIVTFFNDLKKNFLSEQAEKRKLSEVKIDTVYIPQYKRNISSEQNLKHAVAQSIIFPGWGHFHRGYTLKGWIFTSLTAATLASSIYFIIDTNKKHKDYLNQTMTDDILAKYHTYNLAYYGRNYSLIALAAVWLYAQIDLLFISNDNYHEVQTVSLPQFYYDGYNGIQLSYHFSF
jgi:hypothetical protein